MDYLDRFDDTAARLAGVVAAGDLGAAVPACPSWTLADLAVHVGGVHQWAEHAIVAGDPRGEATPAPAGQAELADWYRRSAGSLSATLRTADPAAEAWHFGPKPRTASFWCRRQAHEATMHLADALASQGVTPALADEEFALDGVKELFEVFLPRQERLGRLKETPYGLSVSAGADRWTLGEADPAAGVSGPPSAVLFLLWGRIGLDDPRVEVEGDPAAARAVLASGLTP